jgi:YVTN family beta-propeller protein
MRGCGKPVRLDDRWTPPGSTSVNCHRSRRRPAAVISATAIGLAVAALVTPAVAQATQQSRPVAAQVSVSSRYQVTNTITVGRCPLKAAVDPVTHNVYVTNDEDGTVSEINGATETVDHTISAPGAPISIAIDPNTGLGWVTNFEGAGVGEINTLNNSYLGYAPTSYAGDPVSDSGAETYGIAIDPVSQHLWVSDAFPNTGELSELSEGGAALVRHNTVVTDDPGPTGAQPHGVALDVKADRIFTANLGNDTMSVMNAKSGAVLDKVNLESYGAGPEAIYYDAPENRIFLTMSSVAGATGDDAVNGQMLVLNGSTYKKIATVHTDIDPSDIAVDPADHVIFVANQSSGSTQLGSPASLTVINDDSYRVEQTVLTPPDSESDGVTVDPETHTVYVVNESECGTSNGSVSVVNLVIDSGPGTIAFGSSTASTTAGTSAKITVERSGDTNLTSTVRYATSNGTAKAGRDYKKAHGTLHFAKGDRFTTFLVRTIGTKSKKTLTVHLTLSKPTGGSLKTPKTATLTIHERVAALLSDNLPSTITINAGQKYTFNYHATGRPAPTFKVASGPLPPGLKLNAKTGVLSGTPTTGGEYFFSISASNAIKPVSVGPRIFMLIDSKPTFTADKPATSVNSSQPWLGYDFKTTEFPTGSATFTVSSGAIPTGTTLDPGGVMFGQPTTPGTYTFKVTASNSVGSSTTPTITMTIT